MEAHELVFVFLQVFSLSILLWAAIILIVGSLVAMIVALVILAFGRL
jgi:hypothetical protein